MSSHALLVRRRCRRGVGVSWRLKNAPRTPRADARQSYVCTRVGVCSSLASSSSSHAELRLRVALSRRPSERYSRGASLQSLHSSHVQIRADDSAPVAPTRRSPLRRCHRAPVGISILDVQALRTCSMCTKARRRSHPVGMASVHGVLATVLSGPICRLSLASAISRLAHTLRRGCRPWTGPDLYRAVDGRAGPVLATGLRPGTAWTRRSIVCRGRGRIDVWVAALRIWFQLFFISPVSHMVSGRPPVWHPAWRKFRPSVLATTPRNSGRAGTCPFPPGFVTTYFCLSPCFAAKCGAQCRGSWCQ